MLTMARDVSVRRFLWGSPLIWCPRFSGVSNRILAQNSTTLHVVWSLAALKYTGMADISWHLRYTLLNEGEMAWILGDPLAPQVTLLAVFLTGSAST